MYWYWLLEQVREISQAAFEELNLDARGVPYSYDPANLPYIIQACRATSHHNIRTTRTSEVVPRLDFSESPLLFLSILCDEVQRWDRFAAGAKLLTDWEKYADFSLEANDLTLSIEGNSQTSWARLSISNRRFDVGKLKEVLDERLHNWRSILQLDRRTR
jgi:hypothetical protein